MGLFHVVDDTFVILLNKGVYKQSKLYIRDGKLYGAYTGGFVLLLGGRGTSCPHVSWIELWTANADVRITLDELHPPTLVYLTRAAKVVTDDRSITSTKTPSPR